MIIQMCGLSGSGKSTLARSVETILKRRHVKVEILDGDEYRQTLCKGLGFSRHDRSENIRRMAFVARQLSKHGIVAIICAINPYEEVRREVAAHLPDVRTIHIDCSVEILKAPRYQGFISKSFLPEGHPEKNHEPYRY